MAVCAFKFGADFFELNYKKDNLVFSGKNECKARDLLVVQKGNNMHFATLIKTQDRHIEMFFL